MKNKVSPPAGYRELNVGEVILGTDLHVDPISGKITPRDRTKYGADCAGQYYNHKGADWHAQTFRKVEQLDVPPFARHLGDPGAGYRLLGEQEPVLPTDEILGTDGKTWGPNENPHHALNLEQRRKNLRNYRRDGFSSTTRAEQIQIRRKVVDAGVGYRLLERGEKIERGDEFHSDYRGEKWFAIGDSFVGEDAGDWLKPHKARTYVWRRKVGTVLAPAPAPKVDRPYTVPRSYRELNDGEIVEAGDYMLAKGVWVPRANTRRVGRAYEKGTAFVTIRSTVQAPAGWRLLGPSEKLEEGDRYLVGTDPEFPARATVGSTWTSVEGSQTSWVGIIRPIPAVPAAPVQTDRHPPGRFVGPVVKRQSYFVNGSGRRTVKVERNAEGSALLTFVTDGQNTVVALSPEAAALLEHALKRTK
jgi:hypothetical protein